MARFSEEPGVVSVTDYIEENNTVYLVMEYLRGVTLQQYLKQHGNLSADAAFGMLEPVMRTLEKIHSAGVIHRDISPDNIMVQPNGQLKLMDFGAAKEFVDQSRSMSVMLKKGYAPIEQYDSKSKQGPWTDVYALCATVYRCITGTTPVDSLNRVFADPLQRPSMLGADISPALEDVLLHGLAVRRSDRCQSMTELIQLLAQARREDEGSQRKKNAKENIVIPVPPQPAVTVPAETEPIKTEPAVQDQPDPYATVATHHANKNPNATEVADIKQKGPNETVFADQDHFDPHATVAADTNRFGPNSVVIDQNNTRRQTHQKSKTGIVIAVTAALLVLVIVAGIIIIKPWNSNNSQVKETTKNSFADNQTENDYEASTESGYVEETESISTDITAISAGAYHTVGLKKDGTVVATKITTWMDSGQSDVDGWSEISAISAGGGHTIGLKNDGTVVAAGSNDSGQCNVDKWKDIIAISASNNHTVGLKKDGTVVATKITDKESDNGQSDVSDWTDIIAVSTGQGHTVGLKKDGTVIAIGLNEDGQCDVSGWTNITAISTGRFHTVGLKKDGTVVATGKNDVGQCNVDGWTDIYLLSAGGEKTIGVKKNGTVVAKGPYYHGQLSVQDWTDIIAVSAGAFHTVGLKKDGTVVAIGDNEDGQCDVDDWNLNE